MNPPRPQRELIEGRPALVVIDIQASTFIEQDVRAIDHMPGYAERMALAKAAIDKARECEIPVIFFQEVHRPNLVDFGRELDGSEGVHCLEDDPKTAVAVPQLGFRPDVAAAVGRLSVRQRAAVFLTYWEGLRQDEVAARLDISVGSVKRHLTRARAKLKEQIHE